MNCPECGAKMHKGYLCGRAPMMWTPKRNKLTVFPGKEDVVLRSNILDDSLLAFHCKECHKIVVDY